MENTKLPMRSRIECMIYLLARSSMFPMATIDNVENRLFKKWGKSFSELIFFIQMTGSLGGDILEVLFYSNEAPQ